ncbi:hypothetical protein [Pseudodonghicola xiamenensis]|uniref:Uncharacterized protein n=1 Tax=Pseudodonghicola xiamenensis TaxID=337702 RepID=A0A8J3H717_9RHOB|nr:hypothetical protein [Pseudodonghicola xiamenensis]GHG85552.1 hypothetical protein GCM10010961_12710 [Pseudodonghicola xiamenensis]
MSGKEQVMAVLMGPAEVRQTFRDWPGDMCLAVCLMQSGDCQLMVFHHEEAGIFPRRLQGQLALRSGDLCFFPPVEGFATRALLYSDEQKLMSLVAEAPEIAEEAADYSVNYAYALEEGLDPVAFLGLDRAAPDPTPGSEPQVTEKPLHFAHMAEEREADFVSRRSVVAGGEAVGRVRKALLPGFMQRQEAIGPGPHFRSVRELEVTEETRVPCDVLPEHDGWILIAQTGEGGADIRISDTDLLYLRDDRNVVAIRQEPPWQSTAALPGRIWIRTERLPGSLRGVFGDRIGQAELSGTGSFLYLHFGPRLLAQREPAPFAPMPAVEQPEGGGRDEGMNLGQDEAAVGLEDDEGEGRAAVEAPAKTALSQMPTPVSPPVSKGAAPTAPRAPERPKRTRRRWLMMASAAASLLLLLQVGLQLGGSFERDASGVKAPVDWDKFRLSSQTAKAG